MEKTTGKNIHQRMHEAMKDLATVKKDKRNSAQGYDYVSEEAIKTAVHQALVKYGITFTMSGTRHDLREFEGTNSRGEQKTTFYSLMSFEYRYTNIDNPEDFIMGTWESSAADMSDKSHTKAITLAHREIHKANFVISTGEPDPDGEAPEIGNRVTHAPKAAQNASKADLKGDHVIFVSKVQNGPKKNDPTKSWEAVETDLGRLWNNSDTAMNAGYTYTVTILGDSILQVKASDAEVIDDVSEIPS